MKYCLPYITNFKYMDELDEVIIPYKPGHDAKFLDILLADTKVMAMRIILEVQDIESFEKENSLQFFSELKKDNPEIDFSFKFMRYDESKDIVFNLCKELQIPFFFETYVRDWDLFTFFMNLGVSDMYIVETLAFELDKIGAQAHAKDISIRAFANVCQSSAPKKEDLKSFFIRPEDVDIYAHYIDVLEFYGDDNTQNVMYKIYAKDKKWFGPLKEIIIGLEHDLDSRFVMPIYARTRIKCGKRCLKGHFCNICENVAVVAETLEEKGLNVKK